MPVLSRSSGSVSESRPEPPGNSVANSCAKCSATSANALLEDGDDLLVDRPDHARAARAGCCLHVVELLLQELVRAPASASCSSSASGLIGPMSRSSRSSSRARPASVVPSGTVGRGRVERDGRLDVELGAQRLDRGSRAASAALGVVDLDARRAARGPRAARARARPRSVRSASSCSADARAASACAPAPLAQPVVQRVDARARWSARRRASVGIARRRARAAPRGGARPSACASGSRLARRASTSAEPRREHGAALLASRPAAPRAARAAPSVARARLDACARASARVDLGRRSRARRASSSAAWVTPVPSVAADAPGRRRRRGGRRRG